MVNHIIIISIIIIIERAMKIAFAVCHMFPFFMLLRESTQQRYKILSHDCGLPPLAWVN